MNQYDRFNLDIWWCLRESNSNCVGADPSIRLYSRNCDGYNICGNKDCDLANTYLRPAVTPSANKRRLERGCLSCNKKRVHHGCPVKVYYKFTPQGREMHHQGKHSHEVYMRSHLSVLQQNRMNEYIKQHLTIEPNAAVIGIDQQSRQVVGSTTDIDPCLINRERVAYEMKKAKQAIGVPSSASDPFVAFNKIQADYPFFITSASIIEQQFFISFKPPTIESFVNFARYPIVTDITYKAVKDWYLCSSVIYAPEIAKHVVVFQAMMKGCSTRYLHQYFLFIFTACKLDFVSGKVFRMVMDFSLTQINGFLSAYNMYTGLHDGLKYLKGCYMHWMQSVQRVSSNHNAVPPQSRETFLALVYEIRTTQSVEVFNKQLLAMTTQFPPTKNWIK